MVDSKTVLSQVQELQVVVHEIHAEGMTLSETFQVVAFIEKLPPFWRDFKNYLKHKSKELSLEDLIVRLRIEEDNRLSKKKVEKNLEVSKANVVEEGSKPNKKRKMPSKSREGFNQGLKKFVGKCFNCGKSGHRANDCRAKKRQKTQANVVEKISNGVDDINLIAMIFECNMAGNPKEWWIDTGEIRHICANRSMFSSYTTVGGDEKLYMGNSSTSKVEGVGKIALKMTFGKIVTLINVLHVPDVRQNLVSVSLLSKNGFKLVFVSDKFVLSKNEMYVGKGYLSDGLFELNVMTVITKDDLNKVASSYVLESSNIWHARLGHVNYKSIKKLMNMRLLPNFDCPSEKCQVCVESKFSKPPFHFVDNRVSEPLDLIHTNICNMKSILSRGGNKYFITFIDDCSRYFYVYFLSSKDEAVNAFKTYKAEVETQLNKKIKIIRSDRGGEYEFPFEEICTEFGIIYQTTAPYTPQSNGVAKRKNRSLKETMNALLNSSGLPQNLWGEVVLTANFILNRVPHRKTQQTLYEKWKGRMPNLNYLKVWGCLAKVAVSKPG